MVNTIEWINQNYPVNGNCQRQDDKENFGKKRKEIINLDISKQNLEGKLDLSGFVSLERLNCSYNSLDDLEFLNKLSYPEKLLFLNIDNCCDEFFFREEMKEKVKHFKNLVKLTPSLEKYKEEKKRTESYGDFLSGVTGDAVAFAKKKGQELMLLREIEKEKQRAKELEKALKESKVRDNEWEKKLNELEEIRSSLGSMNKAIIIIANSDDPDQVVVELSSGSKEEKINNEEIRFDSSEDEITLNVKEIEEKENLESLKDLRKQVLYGKSALESILRHERLQKFLNSLSDPFWEAHQSEQEIKSKSFDELKNDFNNLWKGSEWEYNFSDLDKIKLIVNKLVEKEKENEINLSGIKEEIENLCKNKEECRRISNARWAWNEYNKNKFDEAEKVYNDLKNKNSTFFRFQDINYYGSKNAEIYMLYTHVLKKELPEYIEKTKEELGTKFVRFNEKFKKVKDENFGDYVAKKLADSDDFYFSPDRVWKEIESAKEEVLGQILDIAPTIQYQHHEESSNSREGVIKENYYSGKGYSKEKGIIYQNKGFPWKISLNAEDLPSRLYNIQTGKIEKTEGKSDVKNYGVASYVWGAGDLSKSDKEKLSKLKLNEMWDNVEYENQLNPSGYRALIKAIETCKLLGINYLWMDQLCTNQGDNEDKNREVPKMRQYYSNSSMTLMSIDGNLRSNDNLLPSLPDTLKKIISSKWFTRSWTFQEGWLSKQTVFMFDDELVDGRAVAQAWILNQPVYTKFARYNSLEEASKAVKKIATPLGWAYYKNEYDPEDKVDLSLGQVLKEIKNRGRGAPIDGIYSILGLLPYGSEVKVNYKPRMCLGCPEERETKDCKHEDKNKQWPTYSKKDIAEALYEVMKAAIKNGYGEPFAWHGESNGLMPEVINEKGSTDMRGGLILVCKCEKSHGEFSCSECRQGSQKKHDHDFGCAKIKDVTTKENGSVSYGNVEVRGSKHVIKSVVGEIVGIEESKGFLIEGGLYKREVEVEDTGEIILTGSKETLNSIKKDDLLIILDKDKWESESPFAILATKTYDSNDEVYCRQGIVGFDGKSEVKKLEDLKVEKEELTIDNKYDIQFQLDAIKEVEEGLRNYGLSERILGESWKFSFRGKVKEKINKEKDKLLNLAGEVKEWFETIPSLSSSEDYDFFLWLKDKKKLTAKQALENLRQLKEEHSSQNLEAKVEVKK